MQGMSQKDALKTGKVQNFLKLPFGVVGRYTFVCITNCQLSTTEEEDAK